MGFIGNKAPFSKSFDLICAWCVNFCTCNPLVIMCECARACVCESACMRACACTRCVCCRMKAQWCTHKGRNSHMCACEGACVRACAFVLSSCVSMLEVCMHRLFLWYSASLAVFTNKRGSTHACDLMARVRASVNELHRSRGAKSTCTPLSVHRTGQIHAHRTTSSEPISV